MSLWGTVLTVIRAGGGVAGSTGDGELGLPRPGRVGSRELARSVFLLPCSPGPGCSAGREPAH